METARREEEARMEIARREEEARMRAASREEERLEDEALERAEKVKRQTAIIDAQLEILDSIEEESSRGVDSERLPGVSEVSAEDKVSAYVENSVPAFIPPVSRSQLELVTNNLLNEPFQPSGVKPGLTTINPVSDTLNPDYDALNSSQTNLKYPINSRESNTLKEIVSNEPGAIASSVGLNRERQSDVVNYEWNSPDDIHMGQNLVPARAGYPAIQPRLVEPLYQPQDYPVRDIIPPQTTRNYKTIRDESDSVPHRSSPVMREEIKQPKPASNLIYSQSTERLVVNDNQTKNTPSTRPKLPAGNLNKAYPPGFSGLRPTADGFPNRTHNHSTMSGVKPRTAGRPAIHYPVERPSTNMARNRTSFPDNRGIMSFDERHMPADLSPVRGTLCPPPVNRVVEFSQPAPVITGQLQESFVAKGLQTTEIRQNNYEFLTAETEHYEGGDRNTTYSAPNYAPLPPPGASRAHNQAYIPNSEAVHIPRQYEGARSAELGGVDRVLETMCSQMALTRIPIGVPEVFDGKDPLSFPLWQKAFDALINNRAMSATDKLNLLSRFVGGSAKVAIKGYMMLPPQEAFDAAYKQLASRYGNKNDLANGFRTRLRAWPRISGTDNEGLRNFVDYLRQCVSAKSSLGGLRVLDDESENADLVEKLPVWLGRAWARRVAIHREDNDDFPTFTEFVDFIDREDRIAHDPIAKRLQKVSSVKSQVQGGSFASESVRAVGLGSSFGVCTFCQEKHSILICTKFKIKSQDFRMKFVRDSRLCFSCLSRGHQARDCRNKKACDVCQGRHPTVMHSEGASQANVPTQSSATTCASNNYTGYTVRKSSMIVPVYVSHTNNPTKHKVVFAMLDTQSDTSFITDRTADDLGIVGKEVRLSLSTMTSTDKIIKCRRYDGLQVRGFNDQSEIALPGLFSRQSIPINREHIPCAEMLDDWPHLESLRNQFMPKNDCEVGLLIGYNCSRAILPREVISDPNDPNSPFALKTDLGWGIIGVIDRSSANHSHLIGHSHHVVAKQLTESQMALQRSTMEDPSRHIYSPRPPYRKKDKLLDIKTLDFNRTIRRKSPKGSNSQRGEILGDLILPSMGFIILSAFVALIIGQNNVIHQKMFSAISSLLCMGFLVLARTSQPPHYLNYTSSRFQRRFRTRHRWSRNLLSFSKKPRSHAKGCKRLRKQRAIKLFLNNIQWPEIGRLRFPSPTSDVFKLPSGGKVHIKIGRRRQLFNPTNPQAGPSTTQ